MFNPTRHRSTPFACRQLLKKDGLIHVTGLPIFEADGTLAGTMQAKPEHWGKYSRQHNMLTIVTTTGEVWQGDNKDPGFIKLGQFCPNGETNDMEFIEGQTYWHQHLEERTVHPYAVIKHADELYHADPRERSREMSAVA